MALFFRHLFKVPFFVLLLLLVRHADSYVLNGIANQELDSTTGNSTQDPHLSPMGQKRCTTEKEFAAYRKGASNVAVDRKAAAMARATGMANVCYGRGVNDGNSHAAAASAGIPAILIESGQLGSRKATDVECLYRRLLSLLAHIGILQMPSSTVVASSAPNCKFTVRPSEWMWTYDNVVANSTGLWFPQQHSGNVVSGQLLGQIVDPVSRQILEQVRAPGAGRIFISLNALTVRNGTKVAAIAAKTSGGEE